MNLRRSLLAIAIVIVSACSTFDDSGIQQQLKDHEARISSLEKQYSELKSNINALQTLTAVLQSNDVVTGISQIVYGDKAIGFNVTFAKGSPIQIYFGSDSATPSIGVKQDGGIWYWTLNGEWLKDESGNRIVANGKDGVTPQMKIEDEYWYISYDEGKTWTKLSKATTEPGDGVFKSVLDKDNEVVFTLQDGTEIIIPKYKKVNITLDFEQGSAILENTKVPYTITGEANEYEISALCFSSSYTATIEKTTEKTGFINISVKGEAVDSQIAIVVTAPDGESTTRVLQISKYIFECSHGDDDLWVDHLSGSISISITSNLDISAEVDSDWLSVSPTSTKTAVNTTYFTLSFMQNTSYVREGTLVFKHAGNVIHRHRIIQLSRPVTIQFSVPSSTKSSINSFGEFIFNKGDMISVNLLSYEIQSDGASQQLTVPYSDMGYYVIYPPIVTSFGKPVPPATSPELYAYLNIPSECTATADPILFTHIEDENTQGTLSIESGLLKFTTSQDAAYVIFDFYKPVSGEFSCGVDGGTFTSIEPAGNVSNTIKAYVSPNSDSQWLSVIPGTYPGLSVTVFDSNDNFISEKTSSREITIKKGYITNLNSI